MGETRRCKIATPSEVKRTVMNTKVICEVRETENATANVVSRRGEERTIPFGVDILTPRR